MSAGVMLHHVSLGVADLDRSGRFYDAVLAPLGYVRVWSHMTALGYGPPGGGDKLTLMLRDRSRVAPSEGHHLALGAEDEAAVRAFHAAALAHGGTDRGAPGARPHFGQGYVAAFVADPDGHHLEAVVRRTTGLPTAVRAPERADVVVVEASVGDADLLATLNAHVQDLHVAAMPERFKPTAHADVAAWMADRLGSPSWRAWYTEVGGVRCGYVLAVRKTREATPFTYASDAIEVDQIAVAQGSRGAGVGAALMDAVKTWAQEAGVCTLELSTWTFNPEAGAVFERMGFAPEVIVRRLRVG